MTVARQVRKFVSSRIGKMLIAFVIILVVIISLIEYEIVSTPPSDIPRFQISPQPFGGMGFTYNGTAYPHVVNESAPAFSVTFDFMQGSALILVPGYIEVDTAEISVVGEKWASPYTSMSFQLVSASLTIGNYTTDTYQLGGGYTSPLGIWFQIDCGNALEYNHLGSKYVAIYSVTVIPTLHYYLFHFAQNEITFSYQTEYPLFLFQNSP
ncbi:MAG: hypothetical protein ACYDAZ_07045 [Thermoplasmataceae archaeon]